MAVRHILLDDVKPGMCAAKPVTDRKGLLLLKEGTELTEAWIRRLKARNVDGIFVDQEGGDGLSPEQYEQLCRELESKLDRMFRGFEENELMQALKQSATRYHLTRLRPPE